MAAQQNVVAALRGGPVAVLAAFGALLLCALTIAFINRIDNRRHASMATEPLSIHPVGGLHNVEAD
jgi:malonate transporter MadL subunit